MKRLASGCSVRFLSLLATWYLFTLCSNMSGKAFVKTTLDAVSPTTVSLGCAAAAYLPKRGLQDTSAVLSFPGELHRWAVVVGFVQFLATALTYASFALSSVSWTYCFRTLEPLISATLQFVAFREVLTRKELSALLVLASGIVITVNASAGHQAYSAWIAGLAMTATAIYSTRSVIGSRVMRRFQIPGRDLFLLASLYGFFFSCWTQMTIYILQGTSLTVLSWRLLCQLLFTGVFHCIYNLLSFQILELLNPVSHGVCNTMKRVFMVVVSAALAGNWLTPLQLTGIVLANAAAGVYSIEVKKRRELHKQTLPQLLQYSDSDDAILNNATDPCLRDPPRLEPNKDLQRFVLWIVVILLFGVLYLGFALAALASWRRNGEYEQPVWHPGFFANLFSARGTLNGSH